MQPLVKRRPNGEHTTARTCAGFQDDDRCAGLVKKISRAQAGETGADDHNEIVGIDRTRGDASKDGDGDRKPTGRLLKKSSAIHVTPAKRRISHFTSESDIEQQLVRAVTATGSGHWICQRDFTIPAAGSVEGDMTTTLSIQKR